MLRSCVLHKFPDGLCCTEVSMLTGCAENQRFNLGAPFTCCFKVASLLPRPHALPLIPCPHPFSPFGSCLVNTSEAVHRGCEPGEQYDVNVCRECQEQTYSFHPGDDGGQCQTCPDVAHCPGGPIFVPDDHYWHSKYDSDTAQRCPNTFACRCVACSIV